MEVGMHEHGRVYEQPFADQPRKRFRGIAKLAESIRLVRQVTPIEVTASADPDYDAELVDGERELARLIDGLVENLGMLRGILVK